MRPAATVPKHAQILVIGGGPGGSFSAAALAREGFNVVLLEAVKFPRYHIGESMLPSIRPFLRFIGAEQKIVDHGFAVKPGAAVKFNQWKREAYTDFVLLDPNNGSWNVVRSEFDDILLRHAETCGANIFEEYRVTDLKFSTESSSRPVAANYVNAAGETGVIAFDYLVDASGRLGLMSTKYLKNRKMNASLKNMACWGYWSGQKMYMPGTTRENAPWFESLSDECGWAWFIPLHNGTVSVGFVMDSETSSAKKASSKERTGSEYTLKDHYMDQFQYVPSLTKLLEGATMVESDGTPSVKSATDYSYAATSYAGDHFRLVGDASAFIDPFFSSGVHLAFAGGLSAATSIAASIRGHCPEADAATFHDTKVGVSYTRFLLVVMGAYKQIRNQSVPVLCDVDEDNFDRAFDLIRPIIQGTHDVGKKVTEDEVQKTMDFVKNVFAPTDPEMHEAVGARLDAEFFSPSGKIMTDKDIDQVIDKDDHDARAVLQEINARKPIHAMYAGPSHLSVEPVNGWLGKMDIGQLGLVRVR